MLRLISRLDRKGYRQIEKYNTNPWKNNGELHLTPKIRQEIKSIILKQMDQAVDDVYANVVRYQSMDIR